MKDPLEVPKADDVRDVCRYLRTKQTMPTVIGDTVLPWEAGENTEAAYTCLATQSPVGPDDALVHPHHCREPRVCFRPREPELRDTD